MTYEDDKRDRKSIRLKDYDYSSAGAYFVTICTKDRQCCFGNVNVKDENVELSMIGKIARDVWMEIPETFEDVALDEFVFMPNHIHGIIAIHNNRRGLINQNPTTNKRIIQPIAPEQDDRWTLMKNPNQTLGKIIRFFKAKSSKLIHDSGFHDFRWQRNYYERIVRNEKELNRIRKYVVGNLLQWELDEENPKHSDTRRRSSRSFTALKEALSNHSFLGERG